MIDPDGVEELVDVDDAEADLRACRFPDDDAQWVGWYAKNLIAEVRRLRGLVTIGGSKA